ncbi:MAG: hypothetical protein AAGA54_05390 [Myxococcota bacterium]
MPRRGHRGSKITSSLAGVWAGMIIGGSLIAAPAKFQAASLTRTVALDVGRAQFGALAVGEALICVVLVATVALAARHRWRMVSVAVAAFAVQQLLIMPALDARTVRAISGAELEPSSLHGVYVAVELAKVACLLVAAFGRPVRAKSSGTG